MLYIVFFQQIIVHFEHHRRQFAHQQKHWRTTFKLIFTFLPLGCIISPMGRSVIHDDLEAQGTN